MYHHEQIKQLIQISWHYIRPIFWPVMIISSAVCIYDRFFKSEQHIERESYWLNEGKSRSVTDIQRLDYDNRLIIYRPEGKYKGSTKYESTTTNSSFVDWYDISDYYDLYEYYHD